MGEQRREFVKAHEHHKRHRVLSCCQRHHVDAAWYNDTTIGKHCVCSNQDLHPRKQLDSIRRKCAQHALPALWQDPVVESIEEVHARFALVC